MKIQFKARDKLMRKRAIKKVLVIGHGEMHDGKNETLDFEEIQSCISILEEECQAILLTNASSEPMMYAVLDIPIYQLPLNISFVSKVVQDEKPDAVFAPFVDSVGWRMVQQLAREGYWDQRGIEVIDKNIIKGNSICANREIRKAIAAANLKQCQRFEVSSLEQAEGIPATMGGFPIALRSDGKGLSIINNPDKYRSQILMHLEESSENRVLIEQYLSGWKEVTVGILKDNSGEVAVIYTSENVAPIGNYSTNSVSVTPIQTLFKSQLEFLVSAALQLAKTLNDFVGYSAVRFAIDPDTDQFVVSGVDFSINRSLDVSLISGYPLVKIVTKLVMGANLRDLGIIDVPIPMHQNLGKLLLKVPQFDSLGTGNGTHLESSKDNIYVGRNFCEAFRKACYQEQIKYLHHGNGKTDLVLRQEGLLKPYWDQMYSIYQALKIGLEVADIEKITGIDSWFLQQIELVVEAEQQLHLQKLSSISKELWTTLKMVGFTDSHIAKILNKNAIEDEKISKSVVRSQRDFLSTHPSSLCFDCSHSDVTKSNKKIMVLSTASSNSRDESLLQVPAFVLAKEAKQMGFDVVFVGNNTSTIPFWMMFADHLYLEQLNWEIIYEIYRKENPSGIFIEADSNMPELEKRFAKLGAPIVKVPFKFTSHKCSSA